jgi:hypothetical protein
MTARPVPAVAVTVVRIMPFRICAEGVVFATGFIRCVIVVWDED